MARKAFSISMVLYQNVFLILSSPQRLPLGIPIKIAIIEKRNRKRAGDDGKREEAGASLLYFPFSSFSARSLFLFPQSPHNRKSPLRRREVLIVIDSGPDCKRG